ncbi:ran GTPase-activating protein 1 [Plutella xylostella]|uniref:ran GTPase-activating protein 1 n=1 Tax=Plutella xylostella TaxID=51655 RepID=UPI0020324214|nr:ran GTPase-activating protein 1 [Plutella xylostella]
MATLDLNSIKSALNDTKNEKCESGVDFSGKSIKLNTAADAQPIVDAINQCPHLHHLTLTGNTLGVEAAHAIAKALESHPELKLARWSDMFTGRMKTEIPPALAALGDGMITAGARLRVLDLSDNAFGPIGVEGLAKLLQSEVCSELEELRLNNNGLGISGARLLAAALSHRPPRLRVFIAGRNRLENDGATALAAVFSKMGSLQELALPQNGIYHAGVAALSGALRRNPGLSVLNLNDNTIGAKGADALAGALPSLKQLKEINFGDCLLKSKGALALAAAFKDADLPIERLELSHNEIGRAACQQLAAALAPRPALAKVVLAGNSLGGADMKRALRQTLGAAAELSDGEPSDEEYVTGSSEEESGSDEDGSEEEDASQEPTVVDPQDLSAVSLDNSGVEEVESPAARFLQQPSLSNMLALGAQPDETLDQHLQIIKDPSARITAYSSAVLSLSGLGTDAAAAAARRMYRALCARANAHSGLQWGLANALLAGLGLIKSENKSEQISWSLPPCYSVLASVIAEDYFPTGLRDTLRFFISSKKSQLRELGVDLEKYPQLTDNKQ